MSNNKFKGFTLIEILIAVALIAILSAITIIAINPAKHFRDARNSQRSSDVTQILNAVTQYISDQGHQLADLGPITACSDVPTNIGSEPGYINLAANLVPTYIVSIPKDPSSGTDENTGYTICTTDNSRVQIAAPFAEEKSIMVQR